MSREKLVGEDASLPTELLSTGCTRLCICGCFPPCTLSAKSSSHHGHPQSVDAGVGKPQPEGQIQLAACFQRPGCPGPQAGPVLEEGLQETACKAGSLYCLVLDRESVLSLALGKLHSLFLPQSTRVLKVS